MLTTGSRRHADHVTNAPQFTRATLIKLRRGNDRLGHVDGDGEELELSYALRTCAWGFGYATEAVRALLRAAATELPDQPVLIVTQSAYSASLRVGERLGFAIVTTFEEFEAEQTLEAANLHTFRTGEVSRF